MPQRGRPLRSRPPKSFRLQSSPEHKSDGTLSTNVFDCGVTSPSEHDWNDNERQTLDTPTPRRPRRRGRRSGGGRAILKNRPALPNPVSCRNSPCPSDDPTHLPQQMDTGLPCEESERATYSPWWVNVERKPEDLALPARHPHLKRPSIPSFPPRRASLLAPADPSRPLAPSTARPSLAISATTPRDDAGRSPSLPINLPRREPTGPMSPTTPAVIGHHIRIPSSELPETKPFRLNAPVYTEQELSTPRPYNADYPHPLTGYASTSVNPATVCASGYGAMLKELMATDPRGMMGSIISDCGRDDLTAPALMLDRESKEGCGIPEKYWVRLSTWDGVKVPLGAVIPCLRATRTPASRIQSLISSSPGSPSAEWSSTEISSLLSTLSSQHQEHDGHLEHSRSAGDLRDTQTWPPQRMSVYHLAPKTMGPRRASLPDIHRPCDDQLLSVYSRGTVNNLGDTLTAEAKARHRTTCHIGPEHAASIHRRSSMPFNILAPVDEAEDHYSTPPTPTSAPVAPIGFERQQSRPRHSMTPLTPLISDHVSLPLEHPRRASLTPPSLLSPQASVLPSTSTSVASEPTGYEAFTDEELRELIGRNLRLHGALPNLIENLSTLYTDQKQSPGASGQLPPLEDNSWGRNSTTLAFSTGMSIWA